MEKHTHRVLVDGRVIYTGEDWRSAFFEAAKDRHNGTIEHTIDGKMSTTMGPSLGYAGATQAAIPPVQSVTMHHPAFIRGYQDGLATIEPLSPRITDDELVSLLKTLFASDSAEDDLYYHIGNIFGVMDAQTQHILQRFVSVYAPLF